MTAFLLCVVSFGVTYLAARRSLVTGLCSLFTVGYLYGITRAHVPDVFSHLIFDAATLGLYLAVLNQPMSESQRLRMQSLKIWVMVLIAWPFFLFCLPFQDPWIQLVGLRGNVYLLPFILVGARLEGKDIAKIALWFAFLNLVAFGFAVAEYFYGVDKFFPRNQNTRLLFLSRDLAQHSAYRIPATFSGSHAYAGVMVLTFPFLVGAWLQRQKKPWHYYLLVAALLASLLGVFMAAARMPVIILSMLFICLFITIRASIPTWVMIFMLIVGVGWIVSKEERLQRFTTLNNTDYVSGRINESVNDSLWDILMEYPYGNGLGGGGTSIPYFLEDRVVPPKYFMESEIARLILEQGWVGLGLWLAFAFWVTTRRAVRQDEPWFLARRLMWLNCVLSLGTGLIGLGLFTSIPGTCLMLLSLGWVATRQPAHEVSPQSVSPKFLDLKRAPVNQQAY